MTYQWVKLPTSIIDDRTIAGMPSHVYKTYIQCYVLAKLEDKDGQLPPLPDVAFRLRMDLAALREHVQYLFEHELAQPSAIFPGDTDTWMLTRFADEQRSKTNAERQADWRVRQLTGDAEGDLAVVYSTFNNNIQLLTPVISDKIADAVEEYSAQWVVDAIDIAVERNARNWNYINAILKKWKAKGRDYAPGTKQEEDFFAGIDAAQRGRT